MRSFAQHIFEATIKSPAGTVDRLRAAAKSPSPEEFKRHWKAAPELSLDTFDDFVKHYEDEYGTFPKAVWSMFRAVAAGKGDGKAEWKGRTYSLKGRDGQHALLYDVVVGRA